MKFDLDYWKKYHLLDMVERFPLFTFQEVPTKKIRFSSTHNYVSYTENVEMLNLQSVWPKYKTRGLGIFFFLFIFMALDTQPISQFPLSFRRTGCILGTYIHKPPSPLFSLRCFCFPILFYIPYANTQHGKYPQSSLRCYQAHFFFLSSHQDIIWGLVFARGVNFVPRAIRASIVIDSFERGHLDTIHRLYEDSRGSSNSCVSLRLIYLCHW